MYFTKAVAALAAAGSTNAALAERGNANGLHAHKHLGKRDYDQGMGRHTRFVKFIRPSSCQEESIEPPSSSTSYAVEATSLYTPPTVATPPPPPPPPMVTPSITPEQVAPTSTASSVEASPITKTDVAPSTYGAGTPTPYGGGAPSSPAPAPAPAQSSAAAGGGGPYPTSDAGGDSSGTCDDFCSPIVSGCPTPDCSWSAAQNNEGATFENIMRTGNIGMNGTNHNCAHGSNIMAVDDSCKSKYKYVVTFVADTSAYVLGSFLKWTEKGTIHCPTDEPMKTYPVAASARRSFAVDADTYGGFSVTQGAGSDGQNGPWVEVGIEDHSKSGCFTSVDVSTIAVQKNGGKVFGVSCTYQAGYSTVKLVNGAPQADKAFVAGNEGDNGYGIQTCGVKHMEVVCKLGSGF